MCLLSTILFAFTIEIHQQGHANFSDVALLNHQILVGMTINSYPGRFQQELPSSVVTRYSAFVNIPWFLSLGISIATALLAILIKGWCYSFIANRTNHTWNQARYRQAKQTQINSERISKLVLILPSMVNLSLILFAIGLCVYLWELNRAIAAPVVCLFAAFCIGLSILGVSLRDPAQIWATSSELGSGFRRVPINTLDKTYRDQSHSTETTITMLEGYILQRLTFPSVIPDDLPKCDITRVALGWLSGDRERSSWADVALTALSGADRGLTNLSKSQTRLNAISSTEALLFSKRSKGKVGETLDILLWGLNYTGEGLTRDWTKRKGQSLNECELALHPLENNILANILAPKRGPNLSSIVTIFFDCCTRSNNHCTTSRKFLCPHYSVTLHRVGFYSHKREIGDRKVALPKYQSGAFVLLVLTPGGHPAIPLELMSLMLWNCLQHLFIAHLEICFCHLCEKGIPQGVREGIWLREQKNGYLSLKLARNKRGMFLVIKIIFGGYQAIELLGKYDQEREKRIGEDLEEVLRYIQGREAHMMMALG
ncbi:unnamed protein product [Rhizoctonia solani]|uniref:DUF6535 domain-containing protein n=1 Tax=Rhizoctonia solani TaxID=456999 RepID=A0A8H3H0L5_9AGAM|nr:unnamed protein product [Rhizoctonia solani]CAE6475730.1 unnamed protein product [Rhizoctonia solani]